MNREELLKGAVIFSANGFSLSPFVLNGVKIRTIRREIFKLMSSGLNEGLPILPLMESGVIHDDNAGFWEDGQEVLSEPGIEDITVNIRIE